MSTHLARELRIVITVVRNEGDAGKILGEKP